MLDQIDSLLAAAPVFALGASLMGAPREGVAILGSTGSIGVSTLDVIARHPDATRWLPWCAS